MDTQVRKYSFIAFFILIVVVYGAYATLNRSILPQKHDVWVGYLEEEDWAGRPIQKTIRIWRESD